MTVFTDFISERASARTAVYWAVTLLVTAELVVGGMWDVLRIPQVRVTLDHLGYPSYFLVILGVWKLLGALALLAPRCPLLKEWAYAGVFFADSGAVASHLTRGYALGEMWLAGALLALTVLSWALRPASRRVPYRTRPHQAARRVRTGT
jgi:hypothetical protein